VINNHNAPMMVSHLLFVDDTLIFCGMDCRQLFSTKYVLLCFEAMSGLKINLGKFELVLVGSVPLVEDLACIFGSRVTAFPMKYLGLPLGACFKPREIWNPILEKKGKRLVGWKKNYLSRVVDSLSLRALFLACLCIFSLFSIPISIAKLIEKYIKGLCLGWFGTKV
jgi:hypothetical protein